MSPYLTDPEAESLIRRFRDLGGSWSAYPPAYQKIADVQGHAHRLEAIRNLKAEEVGA